MIIMTWKWIDDVITVFTLYVDDALGLVQRKATNWVNPTGIMAKSNTVLGLMTLFFLFHFLPLPVLSHLLLPFDPLFHSLTLIL